MRKLIFGAAALALAAAALLAFFLGGCDKPEADGKTPDPVTPTNPPNGETPEQAKAKVMAGKGAKLFKAKTCNTCHMIEGWGGQNGPDMTEVHTRYTQIKGSSEAAREFYRSHIKDPDKFPGVSKKLYPFVRMPLILMTDEERECLVEFLTTLAKPAAAPPGDGAGAGGAGAGS
ncbi:MAG: cytochrome c [Planctomycetes bacterium]|nr:cytochrome c [Planctomycetota bacterium]